ncbi:MAG: hypothetical protein ACE5JX_21805, partial [Acidobacteriota bacterium]
PGVSCGGPKPWGVSKRVPGWRYRSTLLPDEPAGEGHRELREPGVGKLPGHGLPFARHDLDLSPLTTP